jgi:hypothetical protein
VFNLQPRDLPQHFQALDRFPAHSTRSTIETPQSITEDISNQPRPEIANFPLREKELALTSFHPLGILH